MKKYLDYYNLSYAGIAFVFIHSIIFQSLGKIPEFDSIGALFGNSLLFGVIICVFCHVLGLVIFLPIKFLKQTSSEEIYKKIIWTIFFSQAAIISVWSTFQPPF